jgi:hypothetical protein
VVVGAVCRCDRKPSSVWSDDGSEVIAAASSLAAALVLVSVRTGVEPARAIARATVPRTLAAPTPAVTADIRARPCLRDSCRADPDVGELVMFCSDPPLACVR